MDFAGGAPEHCEVLAGEVHEPSVDRRSTRHDAVGGAFLASHAEVELPVLCEGAKFFEAARIDKLVNAVAGGELALLALLGESLGAAALLDQHAALAKRLHQLIHRWNGLSGHESIPYFLRQL